MAKGFVTKSRVGKGILRLRIEFAERFGPATSELQAQLFKHSCTAARIQILGPRRIATVAECVASKQEDESKCTPVLVQRDIVFTVLTMVH